MKGTRKKPTPNHRRDAIGTRVLRRIPIILLFSCLGAGILSGVRGATLEGYYPFAGNANDASGNGRDCTNYGATLIADRLCTPGQAYSFAGSNFINGSFSFAGMDDFTLALWAKVEPSNINADQYLIQTASGSLAYNPYSHKFTLEAYVSRDGSNGSHARYLWSFTNNIESVWTHLVFVVSADNTAHFYINGADVPNLTGVQDLGVLGVYNFFNIGAIQELNTPYRYFFLSGALDEVRIYNGRLSPTEVLELAVGGASLTIRMCAALTLEAPTNSTVRIDYTEDLTNTDCAGWIPLTTITNLPYSPYPYIIDWDSAGRTKRFYRGVILQ